jgi:hypothetical protein
MRGPKGGNYRTKEAILGGRRVLFFEIGAQHIRRGER